MSAVGVDRNQSIEHVFDCQGIVAIFRKSPPCSMSTSGHPPPTAGACNAPLRNAADSPAFGAMRCTVDWDASQIARPHFQGMNRGPAAGACQQDGRRAAPTDSACSRQRRRLPAHLSAADLASGTTLDARSAVGTRRRHLRPGRDLLDDRLQLLVGVPVRPQQLPQTFHDHRHAIHLLLQVGHRVGCKRRRQPSPAVRSHPCGAGQRPPPTEVPRDEAEHANNLPHRSFWNRKRPQTLSSHVCAGRYPSMVRALSTDSNVSFPSTGRTNATSGNTVCIS